MTRYRVAWNDPISGGHGKSAGMEFQAAHLARIIGKEQYPGRVYKVEPITSADDDHGGG